MAKIHSKERVIEYALDFKIKVVELTEKLDADLTPACLRVCVVVQLVAQ